MMQNRKNNLLSRFVSFNNTMKNIWLLVGFAIAIYLIFIDGGVVNFVGYIMALIPFVISLFHFILVILGEDEDMYYGQGSLHYGQFTKQQDLGFKSGMFGSIEVGKQFSEKSISPKLKARIMAFNKHRED